MRSRRSTVSLASGPAPSRTPTTFFSGMASLTSSDSIRTFQPSISKLSGFMSFAIAFSMPASVLPFGSIFSTRSRRTSIDGMNDSLPRIGA